jgi:hypothetical protein
MLEMAGIPYRFRMQQLDPCRKLTVVKLAGTQGIGILG